jgi:hypothetical protein
VQVLLAPLLFGHLGFGVAGDAAGHQPRSTPSMVSAARARSSLSSCRS